jgi:hypothetical protein
MKTPWTSRNHGQPDRSNDRAVAHTLAVAGLTGVFAYQGLVPKIWKVDRAEVALWRSVGLAEPQARTMVRAVGALEAGFAVATAARAGKRWPFVIAIAAMPVLAAGTAKSDRSILSQAFNPGSLGIAVAALAGVALATRSNCDESVSAAATIRFR